MRDLAFDIRANDRTGQIFDQIKAKANDSFRNVDSAIERLNVKFDAGYRNSLEFARGLRDVDRALAQNKVSLSEAERLIALMTTRLGTSVNAADLAAKGQDRLAAAVRGANASLAAQQRQVDSVAAAGRGYTAANSNYHTANIAAQFQDIAVTASMGMDPFQIALQQGTQLQAVLGPMGAAGAVRALGTSLLSLVSPVGLVTIGLTGAAAAAIGYFSEWVTRSDDSVEALEKQRDLIGSVAARWGDALPAVKAYVDETKRMQELADAREVGQILGGQQFDSVRRELNVLSGDFSDVVQQLEQLGAKPIGIANAQREFDELEKAVLANTATAKDATDVQRALADELLGRSNPAVSNLRDLFGELAEQIRKASGEADKFRLPPQIGDRFDLGSGRFAQLSRLDPLNGFRSTPFMSEEDLMFERGRQERMRREAQGMPVPKLRGIDDVPGEVDFMRDLVRESDIRLRQLEVERGSLGLTGGALAAYRYEQEMLLQAVRQGIALGPDQIATIDRIAAAYGKQADAIARLKLQQDLAFEREQLFRSPEERGIAARLRPLGLGLDSPEAGILREMKQIEEIRDGVRGFFDDFRTGLAQGKDFGDAFGNAIVNALIKGLDKATDRAIDSLINSVLDAFMPGSRTGSDTSFIPNTLASTFFKEAGGGAGTGAPVEAVIRAPLAPIRDAIASIESAGSGGYSAIGPTHPTLGRALGRYQMMEANIGPWSQAALGTSVTADQFLGSSGLQDAIFDHRFGGYVDRYGMEGAAQAWFGGPGSVGKLGRSDVLGTTVGSYGDKFMATLERMGGATESATGAIESMATSSIGATKGLGTFGQSLMNMFPSAPGAPGFNFASLLGGGSANLFTGLLSGFNPLGPMTGLFARGGVFDMGNVVPFADGGVIGSPTLFPMSGGRTGMMGEAGPEAIVPLARGRDGRLGVRMSGTGGGGGGETITIRLQDDSGRMADIARQEYRTREGNTVKIAIEGAHGRVRRDMPNLMDEVAERYG